MRWLRSAQLLIFSGLAVIMISGPATAEEDTAPLERAHTSSAWLVARDGLGRVGVWDKDTGWVRVWKADGSLAAQCRVTDLRVGNFPSQLAIRGDRALLKSNDPPPGDRKKQRALVVDLDSCEVSTISRWAVLRCPLNPRTRHGCSSSTRRCWCPTRTSWWRSMMRAARFGPSSMTNRPASSCER